LSVIEHRNREASAGFGAYSGLAGFALGGVPVMMGLSTGRRV
jgi:hypothetical protein